MTLWRAHGLGNDYLVWEDAAVPLTRSLVVALCDRHRGVGSDGVLEPLAARGADAGVRIWNPDGSVAEKSGNGLRIFAQWWVERRGGGAAFTVSTTTDRVRCEVFPGGVRVEMGRANIHYRERAFDGVDRPVTALDLGNPHAVIFVESELDRVPWRDWGAALETHPAFPNRTNVQIARVIASDVEARIWERGAGETLASGSSACAVIAAAVATSRLQPGTHVVRMPGGSLEVAIDRENEVVLSGPVGVVGVISLDPRWLLAHGAPPSSA